MTLFHNKTVRQFAIMASFAVMLAAAGATG